MVDITFWKDKKVFVTGANGFIGGYVVKKLIDLEAEVYAGVRNKQSEISYLGTFKDKIKIVYGDLKNFEDCKKVVKGMDIVIQLAAVVGGISFNSKHPAHLYRENMLLFLNIIEAARLEKVERFSTVSSACVYPDSARIPIPEEDGFKDLPQISNEGYGLAKRMQEKLSMYYAQEYGMKIAITRSFNAYGPRDHFDLKTSHVIPALIKRILSGENPLKVWGSGNQTRSFLYAQDFAEGILEACERYPNADPINIGIEQEISIKELVVLILKISKEKPEVIYDISKPDGQKRRSSDVTKAKKILNWEAKVFVEEGLRKTIEWYKKNPS